MKLFGFEITLGQGCLDCARLERENTSLRLQMNALSEHHVEIMNEIRTLKAEKAARMAAMKKHAEMVVGLADLQRAPL